MKTKINLKKFLVCLALLFLLSNAFLRANASYLIHISQGEKNIQYGEYEKAIAESNKAIKLSP